MFVLRRTVGTAITIEATPPIKIKLSGIDFLGACALLHITRGNDQEATSLELGPGETIEDLHPDVQFQLLRLSYATHEGTPARVAEFGITAPRSMRIRRTEDTIRDLDNTEDVRGLDN